ncbi:hypothetical protein [Selenomonas sp. F0473]|uniref:hypothetical protein n=1 Tax=Selenomonas sp. F0473 TaxID=999423 RepID=UPI00029E0965|nr:hypothetical protein [Selenomonas sp. F0473]EKU72238.1 hypothetical protein HMPREF9161_00923 [Selenomonas sp. F0473]
MRFYRILLVILLLVLYPAGRGHAAEVSDDPMMLEWTTTKVWISGGELCASGIFENRRDDVTVTGLNNFTMQITFTRDDGTTHQFVGTPKRLPMCKVPAGEMKRLTFNFGSFDDRWKTWVTEQNYEFSYINGAKW